MERPFLLKIVFAAVLLALVLPSIAGEAIVRNPRVGEVPPSLMLDEVIHGPAIEELNWAELDGSVVVVEFWGTSCVPCIQAIPHWNDLVEKFRHQSVIFLSVSDDNRDVLERFLKQHPLKGWIALDGSFKPTATQFGVTGIPHTVIVDKSGKIAAVTHPSQLRAEHLTEILNGDPSTLPSPTSIAPTTALPDNSLTQFVVDTVPTEVEFRMEGPITRPGRAYGLHGWKRDETIFLARKAPMLTVISGMLGVRESMILGDFDFPAGLYDVAAACPPGQRTELEKQFVDILEAELGVGVQSSVQEKQVYSLTVLSTNAPGMKAASKRAGGGQTKGGFFLGGNTMNSIEQLLEASLDQPVIDETGLEGLWAADLKWQMTEAELSTGGRPDPDQVIKAAREQLGLDLRRVTRELPVVEITSPKPIGEVQ